MNKKLKVKCSKCKKEFLYYESKFRPFCSEKCKLIDLNRWLDEDYSVAVVEYDDLPEIEEKQDE